MEYMERHVAIPPGKNFTYILQVKDQIGSFYYYPSLAFHKAAGGFGGIRILSMAANSCPFPEPAALIFTALKAILDRGHKLPLQMAILVNGRGPNQTYFTFQPGKTYRLRISNVGLQHSLNFRIQGHKMKLVELIRQLRTITLLSLLRFTTKILTTTAILHYSNSAKKSVRSNPWWTKPPEIDWSLNQLRSIRRVPCNSLLIPDIATDLTITIKLESSAAQVNGKQRYAVNSVSFVPADTPLKIADYFKIGGVFRVGSMPDHPTGKKMYLDTSVLGADFRAFVEIVFQNP
uniref:Plastocyanin-like domain-containing protein n=2 Tax=Populus alba TaxID=43335 RepID=A0A4U5P465_POPAL|nr:hypothetical protein D5086_0000227840 [Populus alba]